MSALAVTCSRTVGHARNLFSTAVMIAGFLAATAAIFAFSLDPAEGGRLAIASVWTASVAPVLPFLCAFLAMDTFAEERRTGRLELLLSSPVRERDFVFGKFFGVWIMSMASVTFFLFVSLISLGVFAPSALSGTGVFTFVPGYLALGLQSALWCAVAVAASAFFANAAAAASVAVALTAILPRSLWFAAVCWFPEGSAGFGEMPLDAHAIDLSGGVVSVGTVVGYVALTVFALFTASKTLLTLRFRGSGKSRYRFSTVIAVFLGFVATVLLIVLVARVNTTLEFPVGNGEMRFSRRTRGILSESRGEIAVTCFVPRSDRRFRSVSHLLRSLAREALQLGGARMNLRYIDPRWDLGEAGRLVREGVDGPAIVFSVRRRRVVLPLAEGWGERTCASALLRLAMPPTRSVVYWTYGHGETSYEDYGSAGMSDIARELSREGYRNRLIDLTGAEIKVPADCAMIAVAGAKTEFSRTEIARLDAYLRQGGRLMVLAESPESPLLQTFLPSWGVLAKSVAAKSARTLSGTDAVISDFGTHGVTAPLKGSQIVLDRPVVFAASAAAGATAGADRIEFSPIAIVDGASVAVIAERGVGAGKDTAIRPTRIAVIGDAGFVRNAQLEARANANRDFFLNCVAYLSGSHAITSGGADGELLVTGLDRRGRMRLMAVTAGAVPFAVLLVLSLVVWRRRRRA